MAPGGLVLVEAMAEAGADLIVSATRDGVVPSLVIGTGGIWTELLQDVVSNTEALQKLGEDAGVGGAKEDSKSEEE